MIRVAPPLGLALALGLALLLASPAWAQVPPPVMDQVVLDLAAEDWVGTETARVTVSADAAATGADAGSQRADLLKAVDGLAPDADWRVVGFDRSTDQAGLERWRAVAEARLAETTLGGLADKARQASRPGLQLRVASIEFTPTLGETEAARARLRAEIYGKAASELKALEQSFPGRKFRMGNIDFVDQPPMANARKAREDMPSMAMTAAPAHESPVNVSEKLVIRARVVLSAVAPRE
jgi:hypothetical protein